GFDYKESNKKNEITSKSPFTPHSNISKKFRETYEKMRILFPVGYNFLSYVEHNSNEGYWFSTSVNAHLYYKNSFLAFIKLSLDSIQLSPFFNGQIDGRTTDRHSLIFPDVFRRLTKDEEGTTYSWVRFNGDGSVIITNKAPESFFLSLLKEIKSILDKTVVS
ncbi:MAG: hypothetical protein PSX42_05155, partial [bacterium]|nr:hypothetical protein [bacterium]